MRLLVRILWLLVFLLLFAFALTNTAEAQLHFIGDLVWQAPLVVLLLVFFLAGVVFGVLALLPGIVRSRLELRTLRRLASARTVTADTGLEASAAESIHTVAQGARTTS